MPAWWGNRRYGKRTHERGKEVRPAPDSVVAAESACGVGRDAGDSTGDRRHRQAIDAHRAAACLGGKDLASHPARGASRSGAVARALSRSLVAAVSRAAHVAPLSNQFAE